MENKIEIWKSVDGYAGQYEVSNLGNAKSLDRDVWHKKFFYKRIGKILKSGISRSGYSMIVLCKDGITIGRSVHQLVAIAFLGHRPGLDGLVVDHINGDKSNNRLFNLRLVTAYENSTTCFRANQSRLTSQYVGVCWKKENRKWAATITVNKKCKHIGYFDSEIDASNAYQNELKLIN